MKTKLNSLIILILFVSALNACAAPVTPPPPTQTPVPNVNPADTPNARLVLDMVAKMNAGDAEGSLAYFAPDAVTYFIGMPPTGIEIYRGVDQLRQVWTDSVAGHFKWEVEIVSADGDLVIAKTRTWHDFTVQLGVAPNEFTDVYQVVGGKIATYGSTLAQQSLAKFKPALAAIMPPQPTPDTSKETPGSELTFTFADHSCTYSGPAVIKAGDITINWDVKDQDRQAYALTIFTLDEGKDLLDLMAATVSSQPSWSKMIFYKELAPGASQTYNLSIETGTVYVVCWSKPPDLPIGNVGPLEVRQ